MKQIPLSDTFVTAVTDFDVQTASDADIADLQDLIYERKVVALKNQKISRETYQAFAARFGLLEQFKLKNYHDPDYPNILVINNRRPAGAVGARKLGNMWHSDSSYLPTPLALTFLHAQQVPQGAGDTLFVDMEVALRDLPLPLRGAVEGRQAIHDVRWTYKVKDDDFGESIQEIFDRLASTVPAQRHPTILHHPATGRRSLYLNPGYTTQLVGYSADESRRLLDQIFAQVLTPGRVFNYQWEANDLLIWDNRSVWHCATELASDADRLMYRIGVTDREFFGTRTTQGDVA